ncbi:hypothetical protein BHE74_00053107 [Ensete ventricosum]|nr:hypothetical protein BHE74_00053107 [Ensete ventricosum]
MREHRGSWLEKTATTMLLGEEAPLTEATVMRERARGKAPRQGCGKHASQRWLYLAHVDHSRRKARMELEEMALDDAGNGSCLKVGAGIVDSGIEAVVVNETTEWGREIEKAVSD